MVTADMTKRLYKSRTDRMIDGVCGGVAEFFAVDPTLVRLAWVLLTVLGGSGIILYIAAMILVPADPAPATHFAAGPKKPPSIHNQRFWGTLLIAVGGLWLMGNLGIPIWHALWGFSWSILLPVILILAGVAFLFGGRDYLTGSQSTEEQTGAAPEASPGGPAVRPERLYRSRVEKKLFGVCGGLGVYTNVDPTIVRVLFVVSALASFGITFLLYVVMAMVIPKEPVLQQSL